MAKTLDAEDNSFKAEFSKWKKNNKQTLEFFEKCPDTTKAFLFAHAEFWYERVNKAWDDAISFSDDAISFSHQQTKLLEEQRELIELLRRAALEERRLGELSFHLKYGDKLKKAERNIEALAEGRKKGTLARQKIASENRAILQQFIGDFYDNPESPGTDWTNEQVAKWVLGGFGRYKYNTILGHVKRIAAAYRKRKRQLQA